VIPRHTRHMARARTYLVDDDRLDVMRLTAARSFAVQVCAHRTYSLMRN